MATSKILISWSLLFVIGASGSLRAQTKKDRDVEQACQNFVQTFYDWYLRVAAKESVGKGPPWDYALKYKRRAFGQELYRRLKEDSATPADGYLLELDVDPILNVQDPGDGVVLGAITRRGNSYWADVYDISDGKKSDKPIVMPELVLKDHRWVFVNFHYPEGGDLLSILRRNHKELEKVSK